MAAAKKKAKKKKATKSKAKVKKLSKSLLKKAKGGSLGALPTYAPYLPTVGLCAVRRCTTGYCKNRYCVTNRVAYNFSPAPISFSPSGPSGGGNSSPSSGGSRNRARAGR